MLPWHVCLPSLKVNLGVRVCNSWVMHMCNLDVALFSNGCKFDAHVYLRIQFRGM